MICPAGKLIELIKQIPCESPYLTVPAEDTRLIPCLLTPRCLPIFPASILRRKKTPLDLLFDLTLLHAIKVITSYQGPQLSII